MPWRGLPVRANRRRLPSGLHEAVPDFTVCGHPSGPQSSLWTLHLFCSPGHLTPPQAQHAVWVVGSTFPRWGLPPHKKRQASLGARTPVFSCCRKRRVARTCYHTPAPEEPCMRVHPSHGASPGCLLSMSLVVCVMTPPMPKPAVLLAIVTALVWGWFSALSGIACLLVHQGRLTRQPGREEGPSMPSAAAPARHPAASRP
jgi:hypothetical protein